LGWASSLLVINVQTDRLSYEITETVAVHGSASFDGAPLENLTVALEIRDPNANPVITRSVPTNSSGMYGVAFKLQQDALPGDYLAYASCTYNGSTAFNTTSFQVKQTANLVVTVATDKQSYMVGENVVMIGDVTLNSLKLSQALVALEVQDPNSTPIIVRVLETDAQGTYNLTFQASPVFPVGIYTVFASVSYAGSTATADAVFTLKPPANSADLNGDGVVNILDLFLVAMAWGTTPGDPRWNHKCDLDGNNVINIIDIYTVARAFGS
jgi:uncharacterized protein YfaS (alpha-2-macroglobulin family)